MAEPLPKPEPALDADVDAAIEACGGDLHATIRALIIANTFLAGEVEAMLAATSAGYSRGRIRKPPKPKEEPPTE